MRTEPASTKEAPGTSHKTKELLRELVNVTRNDPALLDLEELQPGGEAVLLDITVDGARYLLIRTTQKNNQPGTLSPRELEIARMIAKGYSNKTIADVLEISSWTVDTHLRRIFAKMGVRTRAAMVAHMMEEEVKMDQGKKVKV